MYKDFYSYTAVLTEEIEDGGYSVYFPGLPGCLTEGDTLEEAIHNAEDALGLYMFEIENNNKSIPNQTSINSINNTIEKNEITTQINVIMPLVRDAINSEVVRTTVTLPKWVKIYAQNNHLNISQILQSAIISRMNKTK